MGDLKTIQLAKICNTICQGRNPLQHSQAVFLDGFRFSHHQDFIEKLADSRDHGDESIQEIVHGARSPFPFFSFLQGGK